MFLAAVFVILTLSLRSFYVFLQRAGGWHLSDLGPFSVARDKLAFAGMVVAGPLTVAPFALAMASGDSIQKGDLPVVLAGAGGALAVLVSLAELHRMRHRSTFGATGFALAGLIAGAVVLTAGIKHLTFFGDDGGFVALDFFRDKVKDVDCADAILIIEPVVEQGTGVPSAVTYRCPRGYVINRLAVHPFMPWPDYDEGTSADLAAALAELHQFAEDKSRPAER
ncbi:hypothetical protein H8Z72_22570 (plasmid) [Xanthomonas citri pv. citri]|nr:hypothetical protein [Xanthomonas citri]QRD62685.1 hypothetical protein H8Z74_23615 [Xanthomonas citri pv. citri]QRD71735.1 hypothetical protein H8Z72_22570 [Xanthomonas citri pv. citri]